jgi:hypothetical protein
MLFSTTDMLAVTGIKGEEDKCEFLIRAGMRQPLTCPTSGKLNSNVVFFFLRGWFIHPLFNF